MRTRTRRVSPQCTHGSTLPGAHDWQSGPTSVSECTRRALPHFAHAFFDSGRRRTQVPHSGMPCRLVVILRSRPQAPQTLVRSRLAQTLHTPPASPRSRQSFSLPQLVQRKSSTANPSWRIFTRSRCAWCGIQASAAEAKSSVVQRYRASLVWATTLGRCAHMIAVSWSAPTLHHGSPWPSRCSMAAGRCWLTPAVTVGRDARCAPAPGAANSDRPGRGRLPPPVACRPALARTR